MTLFCIKEMLCCKAVSELKQIKIRNKKENILFFQNFEISFCRMKVLISWTWPRVKHTLLKIIFFLYNKGKQLPHSMYLIKNSIYKTRTYLNSIVSNFLKFIWIQEGVIKDSLHLEVINSHLSSFHEVLGAQKYLRRRACSLALHHYSARGWLVLLWTFVVQCPEDPL